jgi:pyruvate dehydrogenase E1 component beta subunit
MVPLALETGERLGAEGIEIEVVDPRSLVPLDMATIIASVKKTNRAITFEEAVPRGSVGSDIAAAIMADAFDDLDGPVMRIGAPPVPVPFSPALEGLIRPTADRLVAAVRSLIGK